MQNLPVRLKRDAPLVPVDSVSGRALIIVIAILTFLAALCAAGAELVATSSTEWRSSVAKEMTVQVRPKVGRNIEADLKRVVELAERTQGLETIRVVSRVESERLLEPWLGKGLDLTELPVPRLIVISLVQGATPDFSVFQEALRREVPNAALDDHRLWLSRLSVMANTFIVTGFMFVILVLAATALAVAFATRGAMAGNREVVEVLHLVGAENRYIAREFQKRFLTLGFKGGFYGAVAACGLIIILKLVVWFYRESAAGDQLHALFGAFEIGARGYGAMIVIAVIVSAITGLVSRFAVERVLHEAGETRRK